MGHRNTISGHIQEPWYVTASGRPLSRLWHYNRRVIRSLPAQDEWPFLTRRMFCASPMFGSGRKGLLTATYRGPVIYFGGSFSSIYSDWAQWLDKFEALLRRLYWEHAVVVLVTEWMGQHVYRWDAEDQDFSADKPHPIRTWKFEGGPRDFGGR
jgi:hypothetical protein